MKMFFAALAVLSLLATSAHADQKCGPENSWLLAIPAKDWSGPPTVKMVAAGQKRCLAEAKNVKTVSVEPYANLTLDEAQRQEFVPQVSVYETIDRVLGLPKGTTLQSLRMPPYDGTEAYAQVK